MAGSKAGVVAMLVVLAGLSGCATTDPGSTPSPSTATPRPTSTSSAPTPTPTVEPVPGPAQIAEGDCGALLSDAEAAAALGTDPALLTRSPWGDATTALLGGIECRWLPADRYSGLVLTAFPADVVPEAQRVHYADGQCYGTAGSDECVISGTDQGVWMRLTAVTGGVAVGPEGAPAPDALLAALPLALSRAASAPGTPVGPLPEWWALSDCDALAASMDLAGLFGEAAVPGPGRDTGLPSDAELVAQAHGLWENCRWMAQSSGALVEILPQPGAAWAWGEVVASIPAGSTGVSIPGATTAFLRPAPEGDAYAWTELHATDGINVVRVRTRGPGDPLAVAEHAIAALAGTTTG